MNDYIIWRGVDSRDVEGLLVTDLPAIVKPAVRYEETEIPGRDGSLVETQGFQPYDKEVAIALRGEYDVDEITAYFTGAGPLILSNEEEREYAAVILDAVELQKLIRFRTGAVKFRCQPYKHLAGERARTVTATPYRITNAGTVTALPLLHMEGSGTVGVYVNGEKVFSYTFDEAGAVDIDAEAEEAYLGDILKNRNMTGGFPALRPGGNTIEYTGDVKKLEIKINTRFI